MEWDVDKPLLVFGRLSKDKNDDDWKGEEIDKIFSSIDTFFGLSICIGHWVVLFLTSSEPDVLGSKYFFMDDR